MHTRTPQHHGFVTLVVALVLHACANGSDELDFGYEAGVAPSASADAANGHDAGAGPAPSATDAGAARDARTEQTRSDAAVGLDAGREGGGPALDASGETAPRDASPTLDARAEPADTSVSDSSSDANATDASAPDASAPDASAPDASNLATVALAWAEPAADSTLSASVTLRFTGRAFQNVEVFQGSTMLVRATVSADRSSASATLDTTKLANGPITLSAHAWNSAPNSPFTSDADAGPRSFRIDNGTGTPRDKPLVGIYCGNSVDGVRQFEQWLGRPVDGILGYTGNADWNDYDGSVGWASGLWSAIDRRVFWSVPLIVNGASLAQAGSGAYDEHYRKAAQTLAGYRPQEPKLYIRTGWEFNGNWFPWNAQGKANDFKAAFRRFVSVFRSVSSRFVFEWNVNVGDVGMDPETAYPGDDVVDIVGMDFYWQTHLPTNPQQAWSQIVNQKWGLKWHQDFAKAHNKPTAYSEWGVRYDNAGYYIEQAKLWFDQYHVVYHNYWNANNDYPGKLSDGQYPATGSAYKSAFGP